MTPISTEDFPYTLGYVLELLGLDERELANYVQSLNLAPRQDEKTGRLIFNHRDLSLLKKAVDMKRHGEDMQTISHHLAIPVPHSRQQGENVQRPGGSSPSKSGATRAPMPAQDNITSMIEAVSSVKEGILKDLSRLLDDKLSGLDEVVVELIRCKSENDSLKKRVNELERSNGHLEGELSRFKPVQFGFYKKT